MIFAGQKIHILGGSENVGMAREAVVSLILDREFDVVDSKL
jgi:rRNA processing protein Krr1/Pno1